MTFDRHVIRTSFHVIGRETEFRSAFRLDVNVRILNNDENRISCCTRDRLYLKVVLRVLGTSVRHVGNAVIRFHFRRQHITLVHGTTYDEIHAVQIPADGDQHATIGVGRRPSDPSVSYDRNNRMSAILSMMSWVIMFETSKFRLIIYRVASYRLLLTSKQINE